MKAERRGSVSHLHMHVTFACFGGRHVLRHQMRRIRVIRLWFVAGEHLILGAQACLPLRQAVRHDRQQVAAVDGALHKLLLVSERKRS